MITSIGALWNEWQYCRRIVFSFLENLSGEDLKKPFPREKYNTVLEQCNELYEIQQDYVDAIETKCISFAGRNLHLTVSAELVAKMKALDKRLEDMLGQATGNEYVVWFGEKRNIHQHICAMISHEMMHVGQIAAFCYATGIFIPEDITETMALEG